MKQCTMLDLSHAGSEAGHWPPANPGHQGKVCITWLAGEWLLEVAENLVIALIAGRFVHKMLFCLKTHLLAKR